MLPASLLLATACPEIWDGRSDGGLRDAPMEWKQEDRVGPLTHAEQCRQRVTPYASGGAIGCAPSRIFIGISPPLTGPKRHRASVRLGERAFDCSLEEEEKPCQSTAGTSAPGVVLGRTDGIRLSPGYWESDAKGPTGMQPLPPRIDVVLSRDGVEIARTSAPLIVYCRHSGHCAWMESEPILIEHEP